MTAAGLRIAEGMTLPIDAVTQSIAVLARKGAGKSYTAAVIAEEVIGAGVPLVLIDPTGAHWGLRSSADGTKAGLKVVIFGGDHADVSLSPHAGREVAAVVLEHPGAYILDLSAFVSKADELRFAAAFLEALYRGKKPDTGPLLVEVDEADIFAPQQPREKGDQLRTLGSLESIVRRGRIKGLGVVLITQRAAVINKNVLTQTEILIVGQTTGPQDIAAVREWIVNVTTKEQAAEFVRSLASLEQGQMWIWSPSFLNRFDLVRIRRRKTFDSSRTPTAGEKPIVPQEFATIDVEALGERIAAAAEEVKANDPARLKARVATLERELAARPQAAPVVQTLTETLTVEVPVLSDADRALLLDIEQTFRSAIDEVAERVGSFGKLMSSVADRIPPEVRADIARLERLKKDPNLTRAMGPRMPTSLQDAARETATSIESRLADLRAAPPNRTARVIADLQVAELSAYGRRLLDAIASRHPHGLTRAALAMASKSSPRSSSFEAAIGNIRKTGTAEVVDGQFRMTDAGWDVLGGQPPAPTSPDELRAHWRSTLPGSVAPAMFDVLVGAYPDPVDKPTIAERTGASPTSSTFDASLSMLRKAGLLVDVAPGTYRAAEVLFG